MHVVSHLVILVQVRDTGVGISGPGLKSLFKEYAQGSDEEMKRPRTNSGTGLGLNICLKQVRFQPNRYSIGVKILLRIPGAVW